MITDEGKRVKILEACGWTNLLRDDEGIAQSEWVWLGTNPETKKCGQIPDYLNDLNAMHEAEKILNFYQREEYASKLYEVHDHDGNSTWWQCSNASARCRAEAFGLVLGLWKNNC